MIFALSLLVAIVAAYTNRFIKKNAMPLYVLSVIISGAVVGITATELMRSFPLWFNTWIWSIFSRGTLATAFFVVVMYVGALPNKSVWRSKLLPIRAELSIIATILTLAHNISFGLTYFKFMLFSPSVLPTNQFVAGIMSIVMMVIMIPLCITSFKTVRKKMQASTWKNLQRWAYIFYALIYAHVLVLLTPMAKNGIKSAVIIVISYSIVFLLYAAMRISKALGESRGELVNKSPYAGSLAVFVVICIFMVSNGCTMQQNESESDGNINNQVATSDKIDTGNDTSNEENTENDNRGVENQGSTSDKTSDVSDVKEENLPETSGKPGEGNETSKKPEIDNKTASEIETDNKTSAEKPKADRDITTEPENPQKNSSEPAPPPQKYKDGTFTGKADGFNGAITVNVSLKGDVITSVTVVSHTDDEPYISEAKKLTSKIVSAQSASVSAVSGATFSSNGIINATKNALASAQN